MPGRTPRRKAAGSRERRLSILPCARCRSSADRTRSRRTSSPRPCSASEEQRVDFEHSDEQRLLGDSVGRLIAERYDFESRAAAMREPEGWSRSAWREMAEMGLLALPFA